MKANRHKKVPAILAGTLSFRESLSDTFVCLERLFDYYFKPPVFNLNPGYKSKVV